MKKLLSIVLSLCLLWGFQSAAVAETYEFGGQVFDGTETVIDFGKTPIYSISGLKELLDKMPNVTQVNMYASRLKVEQMDDLFDSYPHIFFGWKLDIQGHMVRTDATSFSTLHGRCGNHYSRDFYPLRYCRNLVALDLGHNAIRDLSFLRNFPHMKVLILACNQISDISVLAELKELEYLELFNNNIEDFSPLVGLENLKDLNISNNPVLDITPLYEMKHLERFWSGMNNKIRDQVIELGEQIPTCEIFWNGEPTGGTWRKHPHYDTIFAIFNEGGYRPFDEQ